MLGEVGAGFSGSLFAGIALTTLGLWETPSGCAMRIGFLPAGGASPRATLARTISPVCVYRSTTVEMEKRRWRGLAPGWRIKRARIERLHRLAALSEASRGGGMWILR